MVPLFPLASRVTRFREASITQTGTEAQILGRVMMIYGPIRELGDILDAIMYTLACVTFWRLTHALHDPQGLKEQWAILVLSLFAAVVVILLLRPDRDRATSGA